MFAVIVTFEIKPEMIEAFLPLMYENAAASLRDEPGCHRFDVCTDPARPGDVFLYELYTDLAAFDAHRDTPHFRTFERGGGPMIAAKDVRTYETVYP